MGQGALSKPVVQWWLSLNSSSAVKGKDVGKAAGRGECGFPAEAGGGDSARPAGADGATDGA